MNVALPVVRMRTRMRTRQMDFLTTKTRKMIVEESVVTTLSGLLSNVLESQKSQNTKHKKSHTSELRECVGLDIFRVFAWEDTRSDTEILALLQLQRVVIVALLGQDRKRECFVALTCNDCV